MSTLSFLLNLISQQFKLNLLNAYVYEGTGSDELYLIEKTKHSEK